MIEEAYDWNDSVREKYSIQDETLTYVDPDTITFEFKTPSGVITSLVYGVDGALVRESTGKYHVDLVGDEVGRWAFRWEVINPSRAKESAFIIKPSEFD
jgi:hypothetical protein